PGAAPANVDWGRPGARPRRPGGAARVARRSARVESRARRRADRVRRAGAAREPRGTSAARVPRRRSGPGGGRAMRSGIADDVIERALAEDLGTGDVTTEAIVPVDAVVVAAVVVKAAGVVCGLAELLACVRLLNPDAEMELLAADGDVLAAPPATVARIRGRAQAVLTAERTGLNLVQRMSGIATATRAYVDAVAGTGAEILDTRKTAPGLRALDKRAVACGGGRNHRMGLDDAILIKDNHVAIAGGIA